MKSRSLVLGSLALAAVALHAAPVFAQEAANACTGEGGFVSLSCIPGFAAAVGEGGLTAFFNLLYQMCIGVAAVLAVLQLTRAGIMYMGGDSITEKKEAKRLISISIIGLILVLSPVLILNLINPSINNFDLLTGHTEQLTIPDTEGSRPPGYAATEPMSCKNKESFTYLPLETNQSCRDVKGNGWVGVDSACCTSSDPGGMYQCCARDLSYTPPAQPTQPDEPESESSYDSAASIPSGLWCYQVDTMYVCNTSKAACGNAAAGEPSSSNATCTQH